MNWAGRIVTNKDSRYAFKTLIGKPVGKIPLRRLPIRDELDRADWDPIDIIWT